MSASKIRHSQLTAQDKMLLGVIALGSMALYLMCYNRVAEIICSNAPKPVPYGEKEQTSIPSSSVCWLDGELVSEHEYAYAAHWRNAKVMHNL